jgi:outer membrane usher protein
MIMRWSLSVLLLFLILPGARVQTWAKDIAEAHADENVEVILPIYIDGELYGDIFAVIEGKTGNIAMDAQTLMEAFHRFLRPDTIKGLEQLRQADGRIASRDLDQQGIRVEFDPDAIVLDVHTPLLVRKSFLHNLHSRQQQIPASAREAIRPAPVSAAVDLFIVQEWQLAERQAVTGEADAHINLHDWVLESRQSYNAGAQRRWQRRETRLIRDWPERLQRFSAGDISYKSTGLMGNRPLCGLSLSTSFELEPYSVTYPLSRHEFFLEQASQVDIYINGSYRARLHLPAGRHNILDLPLIQGINQVTLEITDPLGRTRLIEFFETLEQRLLRPGLEEYSFTLGVPRTTDNQLSIDYETGMPALSAFYRTGLFEDLTVGAHLEVFDELAMVGTTGVTNGLWGTLAYDVALSRDSAADATGAGVFADYLIRWRGWSVNAVYRWEDRLFANLNQSATESNTHYYARLGFTLPRINDWHLNLSFGQNRRWDNDVQQSKRLSLSRSFPHGWRVSLDFSHRSEGDESEADAVLRVYWAHPGSRTQGSLGYASLDHARLAEVRYQRLGELGLDARAFHSDSDRQHVDRVDAGYVHSRLVSRLSASQACPDAGQCVDTQSLSFGTAVAYADGHLAVSRPLHRQPFVLLSGNAGLGGHEVRVIRGLSNRPAAILDGASVVLPNLSPYYINQVNLDVHDLPIGMQIERDSYNILPGYRSGVSLQVGAEGRVYLVGRLVDPKGQPLSYVVGQLRDHSGESLLLFTDEQGHFEAAGVVSGRYRVVLDAPNAHRGELNVPEESVGIFDIGDVVMEQQ